MKGRPEAQLTLKILFALMLGALFGFTLNVIPVHPMVHTYLIDGLLDVVGQIFIKSLKLLVVPLIFVSLICGVLGLDDVKKLGKIGGKALFLYILTTAAAISLAIFFAVLVGPGLGFHLPADISFAPQQLPSLREIILNLFPSNPVKAAADDHMLQIILLALLVGYGLVCSGEAGQRLATFFTDLNQVIMQIVMFLMRLAPYGVFALIAKVFAVQGFSAILPLSAYFFTVLGALLFQFVVVYTFFLAFLAKMNPLRFFQKLRPAIMFAFSTASSNATLPITMKMVIDRLGVHKSIASFTLPLGATINMDGTSIMQGVATVFIAQAYQIDLGLSAYLMVIIMATLASIGTAGVPGVGLITLAMVLRQVNLPIEGIALIIGVDRLLDMARTVVNITGDAVVTCVVARSEAQIDDAIFKDTAWPAPQQLGRTGN